MWAMCAERRNGTTRPEGLPREWIGFRPGMAEAGARVLSYPDHRGISRLGRMILVEAEVLVVAWEEYGVMRLDRRGRLLGAPDTSADINLIRRG